MKKIIILISLAVSATLAAQVPGYMGRRFLISANLSPNVILPVEFDGDYLYGNYPVNSFQIRPRFGASVDWTLTRNQTIGIKYSFVQTGASAPIYYLQSGGFWYPDEVWSGGNARGVVKSHSIGLRFAGYGRRDNNLPAPVGLFGGYQLGVGLSQFYDTKGQFLRPDGKVRKGLFVTTAHPEVILFIGIRRGLGKKVMWSFLSEFNFAYLGYFLGDINWEENNPASEVKGTNAAGQEQYITNKYIARGIYYNANLFNLTFEFTFLPF